MNTPYKRGAVLSSSVGVAGRFVAFAQNLLIAYYLGANIHTDIYFYLFNLCVLLIGLGQNLTTSVIVPYSVTLRSQGKRAREMAYVNAFLTLVLMLGLALIIVTAVGGTYALNLISGFSFQSIRDNCLVVYLFAPATALFFFNSVLAEILVSHKKFVFPVLINLINNVFIILFIVLFHASLGILSAVVGLFLASLIGSCWMIAVLRHKCQWRFSLVKLSLMKATMSDLFTMTANQAFVALFAVVPMYLLSWLHPSIVTVVSYAVKLSQTPVNILTQVLSVLQMKLNELASAGNFRLMKKLYVKITAGLASIALLGTLVLYLLKAPLIELFYGHGDLESASVALLIDLFGILVFSIPFMIVGISSCKLFFSFRQIKLYAFIIFLTGGIGCVINYFFIKHYAAMGFAYAFVLAEMITMLVLVVVGFGLLSKACRADRV